LGRDHPSRTKKDKRTIEKYAWGVIMQEVEKFVEQNLPLKTQKEQFKKRLDKAAEKFDSENILLTVGRFLLEIPDVKYKLDQRMQALVVDQKLRFSKDKKNG
jgi:hypothetical protein